LLEYHSRCSIVLIATLKGRDFAKKHYRMDHTSCHRAIWFGIKLNEARLRREVPQSLIGANVRVNNQSAVKNYRGVRYSYQQCSQAVCDASSQGEVLQKTTGRVGENDATRDTIR